MQPLLTCDSQSREMERLFCCHLRAILVVNYNNRYMWDISERRHTKECVKQLETLTLIHTVQNDSRLRVGKRVGEDGVMNQMLAVLVPGLLSLQQDMRGPCRLHPNMRHPVLLNFHQMTKAKNLKGRNLSSVWICFPESHLQTYSLWLPKSTWSEVWGSKWFQNLLELPRAPHGFHSSMKMQVKSNVRATYHRWSSWRADAGRGRRALLRAYLRYFPHEFCSFILNTKWKWSPSAADEV